MVAVRCTRYDRRVAVCAAGVKGHYADILTTRRADVILLTGIQTVINTDGLIESTVIHTATLSATVLNADAIPVANLCAVHLNTGVVYLLLTLANPLADLLACTPVRGAVISACVGWFDAVECTYSVRERAI